MDLIDSTSANRPAPSADIELHIAELVLHGFPAASRERIAASLSHELSRLISATGHAGLPAESVQMERLDAGTLHLDPGAHASHIGRQVARSAFRQISGATAQNPSNGGGGATHV